MKTARHLLLSLGFLFFGSAYFLTESKVFIEWFSITKPDEGCFSTDRYRYGDLFGLSFIPKYKSTRQKCTFVADTCNTKKNISLFIIGDSYMYKFITAKQFCGVEKVTHADWDDVSVPFRYDTSTMPVLIIETTERYLRGRMSDINYAMNKILTDSAFQKMPPA